jgi:hypothetical protein
MEDSKMRKICLLFLTILTLLLTSCRQDTTQLAKDEFSKYYNGKDEVVLNIEDNLYFENYALDLNGLVKGNEHNNGLIINQRNFFFSTSKENSMFNFTLNIYESTLQGTDIKLVYSKDGFKTHPWAYAIDDVFYIEHYSNNALDLESKLIDSYTISTGIYENIASGKDCSLSDYMPKEEQSRYSIEVIENISPQKHGKFIVTDLETGLSNIIDDEYLRNTIYIESMEKFNYSPKRVDISNGHILLTYGIGAGDGWNYPHLVFEYDFDSNTLEYKLLAFPFDSVPIEIIYIG